MAIGLLPFAFYSSFNMFKTLTSDFGTVGMRRLMQACADEFFATVTEGVVHGVYEVITQSSFSVTWQH